MNENCHKHLSGNKFQRAFFSTDSNEWHLKTPNILGQGPFINIGTLDIINLHIFKSFKVSNRYIFFTNKNAVYSNKETSGIAKLMKIK